MSNVMNKNLSRERLFEVVNYDPETGFFTWKKITSNRAKVGEVAGNIMKNGYWKIGIDKQDFYAHRLAWFYVHGYWPDKYIDHVDGNKLDNSITNLREATNSQNGANRGVPVHSRIGMKGVRRVPRSKRFAAQIQVRGGPRYLGMFDTMDEAHAAYFAAAREAFGEFARAS
jgi:hypothetical protein